MLNDSVMQDLEHDDKYESLQRLSRNVTENMNNVEKLENLR